MDKVKESKIPSPILVKILEKYVRLKIDSPISSFAKRNGITSSDFYEALRYPYNKGLDKLYNSSDFKYKGFKMIEFYKGLLDDINKLEQERTRLSYLLRY